MNAEINVTSLVDVAFTLLVIFIITAPILQGGIEVNLPEANVRPVTSVENTVIVSIRADSRVFLEETEMSLDEFEAGFAQLAEVGGTKTVHVRADQQAPWGVGVRVMSTIANAGVGVSVIAEPKTQPRR
jgi:biopolymer transport protein TolR